ncbi:putative cytochrome P450 [Rostrohypoxylon terebratum]|nr:putative cytochrome P450 [Rostrohypoxylon terebratum]
MLIGITTYSSIAFVISFLSLGVVALLSWQRRSTTRPPLLSETIPFVTNAWQFATNKDKFLKRLHDELKRSPIVRCHIGPVTLHFVTGPNNISALFRSSFTSDPWVQRILGKSGGYSSRDVKKFAQDDSGSAKQPRRGSTRAVPKEKRIWYAKHTLFNESLLGNGPVNTFATSFQTFFHQELNAFPVGRWNEDVQIFDFLKRSLSTAATRSVFGSQIIDSNPGFIEAFWEYERFVEPLAFGLPGLPNSKGVKARDRFKAMCLKWYQQADREFDSGDANSNGNVDWEPVFGSLVSRKLAQWAKSFDFSAHSQGAAYTLFLFGLHANTIPITTWIIMELIQDLDLFQAVKKEVSQVEATRGDDGEYFNHEKLASLPLLQSVYTEVLRLHVRVLITRTSIEPAIVAGFHLPKGSIIQAPTEVCHLDEAVWGTPDHPASEFWAYRHVKVIEPRDGSQCHTNKLKFSLEGKTGSFFPFGGGMNMCAGRNFAKQEVLLAVAFIVSRFEIEFLEWVRPGGGRSERPPLDDTYFANAVACPPDRDMKVRWLKTR